MDITTLIDELQKMLDKHGDVSVVGDIGRCEGVCYLEFDKEEGYLLIKGSD